MRLNAERPALLAARVGIATALLFASQVVLASLPNIEIVSVLLLVYTRYMKKLTLYVIYAFALLEGLVYGFHVWFLVYLYIWMILYLIARAVGEMDSPLAWAFIAAVFGLAFGTLSSIPYFFILGVEGALAYIGAGLVFDLAHCAGNFVTTLLLYAPLCRVFEKVWAEKSRPVQ